MPVFKIKSWGGDNRVKMVHRNLFLPLLPEPWDHAGELDNSRSLANPKETMGTQVGNCGKCNCQSFAESECL